jgi:hypothetical protein
MRGDCEKKNPTTGSNVTGNRIGIVRVARRAASTACALAATMTSTLRAPSRSTLPSAFRSPT